VDAEDDQYGSINQRPAGRGMKLDEASGRQKTIREDIFYRRLGFSKASTLQAGQCHVQEALQIKSQVLWPLPSP